MFIIDFCSLGSQLWILADTSWSFSGQRKNNFNPIVLLTVLFTYMEVTAVCFCSIPESKEVQHKSESLVSVVTTFIPKGYTSNSQFRSLMWQMIHLVCVWQSVWLTVRILVLDWCTAWVVSDYFHIILYPILFPHEGLLKHFVFHFYCFLFCSPLSAPAGGLICLKELILDLQRKTNSVNWYCWPCVY